MGVAHHSSYLLWFELARTGLLREAGHAYRDLESDGVRLPVLEYGCKFPKSADYDDALVIETRVRDLRSRTVTFEYIVHRGDEMIAEGFTHHVCVDSQPEAAPPSRPRARGDRSPSAPPEPSEFRIRPALSLRPLSHSTSTRLTRAEGGPVAHERERAFARSRGTDEQRLDPSIRKIADPPAEPEGARPPGGWRRERTHPARGRPPTRAASTDPKIASSPSRLQIEHDARVITAPPSACMRMRDRSRP